MLQLQRDNHSREIAIRLRGKEPMVNPALMRALGFAISIHLLALFLFRIEDINLNEALPLPPITVELDLGIASQGIESAAVPELSTEGMLPRYVLEPEALAPEAPTMPLREVSHLNIKKGVHHPVREFERVEGLAYRPEKVHFAFRLTRHPVKVRLSGRLAGITMTCDGMDLLNEELKCQRNAKTFTAKLRVKLDSKSGEIFWLERLQSSGEKELDQLAHRIVQHMRFDTNEATYFADGDVLVTFTVPPTESYNYLLADQEETETEEPPPR